MPFRHEKRVVAPDVVEWSLFGDADETGFAAFMADGAHWLRALQAAGQRSAVIVDPSGMTDIPANLRKLAGEWRKQHAPIIKSTIVAAAYITPSAFTRGVITAIFWVYQPIVPAQTFGMQHEALAWLERRLREDAG